MDRDILIVNGSPDRQHTSRELLERAGYEVNEVISMDNALEVARRAPPLAVVIESPPDPSLSMRFARLLRRHPTTRDVPVVILRSESGSARSEEQLRAVSWLPESCSGRTLLEEVAYLTRPARTTDPSMAEPRSVPPRR